MPGYANRVRQLHFPDLSEDDDLIWVSIRNPKTQTADSLKPPDVEIGPDGRPVNADEATDAMYHTIAGLILGAHVYDASFEELDADGSPLDQPLLVGPWTAEKVRKLPMEIITTIAKEITAGSNPQ